MSNNQPNKRDSRHKIMVTLEQFEWMQRTVPRFASRFSTDRSQIPLSVATAKLGDKLATPPEEVAGKLGVNTNRNDLRILEQIITFEHTTLITAIIPGYEERIPQDQERYQGYRDAAVKRASMLVELLNEVKRRLA